MAAHETFVESLGPGADVRKVGDRRPLGGRGIMKLLVCLAATGLLLSSVSAFAQTTVAISQFDVMTIGL